MKKGNRQKVQLSKNAKKVLAGVLATSMTLSGTMFAFADSETAAGTGSIELTSAAAVKYGHSIANTVYGDVLELAAKDPKGEPNKDGVKVENPFVGADVKESITPTALKDDAQLIAHEIPVMTGKAVDYYLVGSEATTGAAQAAFDQDVINAVVTTKNNGTTANDYVVSGDTVIVSGEGSLAAQVNGTTVKVINQAKVSEYDWMLNPHEQKKFSYPLPNFKKGVSISTWVKVPTGTTEAAPIFSFVFPGPAGSGGWRYPGNLTLDTDGTLVFMQVKAANDGDGAGGRNYFKATFASENTPLNKAGNWVYVTASIKNDEFQVYYNGEPATKIDYARGLEDADEWSYSSVFYYKFKQDKVGNGVNSFTESERSKFVYSKYKSYINAQDETKWYSKDRVRDSVMKKLTVTGDAIFDAGNWNYNNITNWDQSANKNFLVLDILTTGTGDGKNQKVSETAGVGKAALYFGGVPTKVLGYDGKNLANYEKGAIACTYAAVCEGLEMRGMSAGMTWLDATGAAAAYKSADAEGNNYLAIAVKNDANAKHTITTNTSGASIKIVSGATQGVEMVNPFKNRIDIQESINEAMVGQKLFAHVKKTGDNSYTIVSELDETYAQACASFDAAVVDMVKAMPISLSEEDAKVLSMNDEGTAVYGKGGKKIADVDGTVITAVKTTDVDLKTFGNKWKENPYNQTDYVFPLPSYSKGVTLSAWVKVKQGESKSATIFEFKGKKSNEVLLLDTNGKLVYREDASGTNTSTNTYSAIYDGSTPLKNAGQWIYVTLSIKNDEIQVYYNGTQASATYENFASSDYATFNGGFGWKQNKDEGKRIEKLVQNGRYRTILKGKSKWNLAPSRLIMDFLTEAKTELFLGGNSATLYDYKGQIGNVTEGVDGMQMYAVTSETTPLTASEAAAKYKTAAAEHKASADENASGEYTGDVNGISFDTAVLNSEINSSTKTADEKLGDIITLGKITEEVADSSYDWKGVEIDNPFKDQDSIKETLPKAFENSGKKFNGYLYYPMSMIEEETPASAGVDSGSWKIATYPTKFWIGDRPTDKADTKKTYEYYWFGGDEVNLTSPESLFLTKANAIKAYDDAATAIQQYITDGKIAQYLADDETYWNKPSERANWLKLPDTEDSGRVRYLQRDGGKEEEDARSAMKAYLKAVSDSGLTANMVAYTYNGPQRGYPSITKYDLQTNDAFKGEFSYPVPVWTKGGSISTWVKVPADTTQSAVILAFSNDTGVLTLRTDGTVYFTDGTETNTYKSKFVGRTPLDNAGNWTYVTMSIKNDGVDVYFDGIKATESLQSNVNSEEVKYFNGGFGPHIDSVKQKTNADRLNNLLINNRYEELFSQVATGAAIKTDGTLNLDTIADIKDDYSNYKGSKNAQNFMVDFLAGSKTKLYLGGYTDSIELAQYTDANAGMQFDDVTYTLSPISEEDAAAAYNSTATHPGEMAARIALTDTNSEFATTVLSSGEAAKVVSDDSLGTVAELEGPVSDTSAGIKIANPFAGKENLSESVVEALNNAETPLNAALHWVNESGKQYYKVYPYATKKDATKVYEDAVSQASAVVVASVQALTPAAIAGTITRNDIHVIDGIVRAYDGFNAITDAAGQVISYTLDWKEDPAEQSEYTFPLPVYKKGASFSTWVKVAEGTTEPATIFTFVEGKQLLTMKSDGTVFYTEIAEAGAKADDLHNCYKATYTGATPLANAGKWTYVTLSIKNDELQVYYNGKAAESVDYVKAWDTATKTFNGGFGFVSNYESTEQRRSKAVSNNRYLSILQNYGMNHYDAYDQDDMWYVANADTIMAFLTSEDTELYLGGIATSEGTVDGQNWLQDAAGNWYTEKIGDYTAANAGMQFKNVDACFFAATAAQALQLYKATADDVKDQTEVAPTPEPTETPSPSPSASASPAPTESESPEPTETTAPVDYTLGDINNDGDIDLTDAQLALQLYLELDEVKDLTDAQKKAADVNQNDDTDLSDVQQILQYYLGDITEFVKE